MELKKILEDFLPPDVHNHHNAFPDAASLIKQQHDHPGEAFGFGAHPNLNDQIKDPSIYYIQDKDKPDDGSLGTLIPKDMQASDANFKMYDANHDGILDQKDLFAHLKNLSKKTGVPMDVIKAIINKESRWDPDAIGHNKGSEDIGLMQLNSRFIPDYIKKFWKHDGVEFDPKNPFHNSEVAINYLKTIHSQFKADGPNWDRTIMAYNIGPTAVANGKHSDAGQRYVSSINKMIASKSFGLPKGAMV